MWNIYTVVQKFGVGKILIIFLKNYLMLTDAAFIKLQ